jgi:Predicted GTPase
MANLTGEQEYNQQQAELEKDLDSRLNSNDLPEAKIMVAGITGTGKSTLVNAVFGSDMAKTGSGKPVTEHIDEYHNNDIPIRIWDTVGLELDSEKTKEAIRTIKETIASKAESSDPYDRVHAIWYCINSGSNRYQGAELDFIKELHSIGVPFIIVLTQCSGDEDEVNAFESEIRKINAGMGLGDVRTVQVLALPVKYRGVSEPIEPFGLEELVNVTLELLPSFIKSGFTAAQRVSQGEKRRECEEIICSYVRAAQNGFWDKVPLVQVFAADDKIMKMFRKFGEMYNTVLPEGAVKKILSASGVDFKNNFWGLISPIDMGYSKKITALLEQKKKDGFTVEVADVGKNDRAARMIAFYGYTFVDSIEELWKRLTAEQLKDIDVVMDNLIAIINRKLSDRNRKTENGGKQNEKDQF